MTARAVIEKIPAHLEPYIAKQDPSLYTPIDHASWRFILRISKAYFAKCAHRKYLDGLVETGISTERIPLISEMDQKLRRFGWRAVPVSGFIPPAVFMEFQSLGILPIACEMRTLEHLAYTPAPDIVHEAAGHAPIIADPEYANYLRSYGEVSRKAIFSSADMAVYQAIRELSDVKENPASTPAEIAKAQERLDTTVAASDYVSEASYLARMNWWTVEYGLVGDLQNPKIYGAGLLSSVGESYECLKDAVKKIPFSLDCVHTSYDITRPQPQLFVTPNFGALGAVLEEFAKNMAFRKGGPEALAIARRASTVTTSELETGLQISGVIHDVRTDSQGRPSFLKLSGPVQLGYRDAELEGHGPQYHRDGFSSPIGRIKGTGKTAAELTAGELESLGFKGGAQGKMIFESGIELTGVLKSSILKNGANLVLTFENCTVKLGGDVLFQPDWGVYDLACGTRVVSVYGGAADRGRYLAGIGRTEQTPKKPKCNLTEANRELNDLYARVRRVREEKSEERLASLAEIHARLEKAFPNDWLLRLELLELDATHKHGAPWAAQARQKLELIAKTARDKAQMIQRGLELI